jgi:exonuclease SbcC
VDENVAALRSRISAVIDNLQVDESRLGDPQIFRRYYNDDPALGQPFDTLEAKLSYITAKYNVAKAFSINILVQRLGKVTRLEAQVNTIKNKLAAAIKSYKRVMIDKIKVPFYIYSGKILQHYQQGYGIFVDVSDTTNNVRFRTDAATDHDIIHQLSSGQLAVVSIAFCLALNKVYETPSHFNFLAIDDPIQTLDDLNIHSFVELIRHEFANYQMLISTHEENVSNYLDYRFNKFNISCREVNVQNLFYRNQIE